MKKHFKFFLAFTMICLSLFVFSACKEKKPFNGVNEELGIRLTGGGYDSTATLMASKVTESVNVTEIKNKLAGQQFNDTAELYIYYINVLKNGATKTPDGSVKITVPEPKEKYAEYIVFNVSGEKVKILTHTVSNGKISFETSELSYFIIADSHVHAYGEYSDTGDGNTHSKSCFCGYVAHENHNYDKGVEKAAGRLYTCQTCGYSYIHVHEYRNYINSTDGKLHMGTCSCGATVTENHNYDQGTETETGTLYTCQNCGHKKTVPKKVTVSFSLAPNDSAGSIVSINGTAFEGDGGYTTQLEYGTEITVTVKAAKNYRFSLWRCGDEELEKNTTFTFTIGKDSFTLGKSEIYIIVEFSKTSGSVPTPIL